MQNHHQPCPHVLCQGQGTYTPHPAAQGEAANFFCQTEAFGRQNCKAGPGHRPLGAAAKTWH